MPLSHLRDNVALAWMSACRSDQYLRALVANVSFRCQGRVKEGGSQMPESPKSHLSPGIFGLNQAGQHADQLARLVVR